MRHSPEKLRSELTPHIATLTTRTNAAFRVLLTGIGWLTVAVGVAHLAVAFLSYQALSLDTLWFAGSGITVVLIGVLSLLARLPTQHNATRWAAVGANAAGLALAVIFNILTAWREPQGVLLVLLFTMGGVSAATAASRRPSPARAPSP